MEMAYLWGAKHGPTQSLFHTVLKHKGGTKQKHSLCIFQLFIFRESAGFYQVIVDAVGLDSIYQFQYCQTGADLLVLIGTVRLRKQKCVFLTDVLTNIWPRLTLKLEILVDFPASANVLLTQFTMMPSDLSPPPNSSSTFNVYLKKDKWQSDQIRAGCFWTIILCGSGASPSHQLPHQPQGQGWDASVQVVSANSHNGEICRFAQIHSIVTVLQLMEGNSGREKEAGYALFLGAEQVLKFGFTFFMLVPSLGYGGLLTLFQSTGTFILS